MRPYMTSAQFWSAAFERAVKSFAQGCLTALTGNQIGWWDIDWQHTLGAGLMMALLSVLTSLASDRIGSQPGPSLVKEAVEVPVASEPAPFVYPAGDANPYMTAQQSPTGPVAVDEDELARRLTQ